MWRSAALVFLLAWTLAGCSLEGSGSAAPAAPDASSAKLRLLSETYAPHGMFRRVASVAALSKLLPIAGIRPQSAPASDRSIDSVWLGTARPSGARDATIIWKSGVVETFERWSCNCVAAPSLRRMAAQTKPFRYLSLRGAPGVTAPSSPGERDTIGLESAAQKTYGVPASVETIRDGYNVTLWEYGARVQAGLLTVARTLPVDRPALRVSGYAAGGAALGDWSGRHGIAVARRGGARFGIGAGIENVSGEPLTIKGVNAIDGFIHLIGVHVWPYTHEAEGPLAHPSLREPYGPTPARLHYVLRPGAWGSLQLDYLIENPCTGWVQTFYDTTVEVVYEQDGVNHIQAIPMVRLNTGRGGGC